MHNHINFRSSAAMVVAIAGLSVASTPDALLAADQPNAVAAAAVQFSVVTGTGAFAFRVDAPDAEASAAARDDRALTHADGSSLGWTPGYQFTSRVVVNGPDHATVAAAIAKSASKARITAAAATGPLSRFFYVEAASVREAIGLADAVRSAPGIAEAYLDIDSPKALRNNVPTDPGVPQQWHLINAGMPDADINADIAWKAGFTGEGVTVGILEGGWDITHADLAPNYHPEASQLSGGSADHGTGTAGLVAGVANNGECGAGVAWNARLSRLYYGSAIDIATAFCWQADLNKVLTNSWGPPDNGWIASISSVELAGIACAATTGRGGLGEVIVWAAGNGQQFGNNDRLDYDQYGSNRFSIAIGAIDSLDRHSLYSEPGSALMLVAPSDYDLFNSSDVGVYTTWSFNTCTSQFGGTSAASPIAAGVAALVLQANPLLSARDVQHVLIRSARRVNPTDPTWGFNGAGAGSMRAWSELFGFGAIDAGAAVALAQTWTNRPPESTIVAPVVTVNQTLPDNNATGISSNVNVTGGLIVERAQLTLLAPHSRIGQLRVTLTSPTGSVATLAALRNDNTAGGYNNFTFSPVRFWDERAAGTWTLRVSDETAAPLATGSLMEWQLKLYGYTPACACDWNLSGGAPTVQDLFDYLSSYFAGRGDLAGDGVSSLQDLFDFLACWFAGC